MCVSKQISDSATRSSVGGSVHLCHVDVCVLVPGTEDLEGLTGLGVSGRGGNVVVRETGDTRGWRGPESKVRIPFFFFRHKYPSPKDGNR